MPAFVEPPLTLLGTWHLNNRVTLMLLESLSDEQLSYAANPRARSIADQFAHLHNVRLMWLEPRVPEIAKKLTKLGKGTVTKTVLEESLRTSAFAVGDLLTDAEREGKMQYYRRGAIAFFGYALAHEAHHRGQIIVHLKQAGLRVDPSIGFRMWEWDKI